MLEIRLLGQFDVQRDGEPIEITSRPARLLLAHLLLTAGTQHPRERLAGLLWPESDETNARSNLRQALWRLRKGIGDDYLLTDAHTAAFNTQADYWLDVDLLKQNDTSEDFETAVSAYQGELLPGYYADWVLLERERLQSIFERKIQLFLGSLLREKQWPDVLNWAEHWIAFGQVPEPAYRALMTAHAAQGDLAAVAGSYERCVSALQQDIGVDPSPETQALYDRLIRNKGSVHLSSEDTGQPDPKHNLPHQSTPFIGREQELAELKRLLSKARMVTLVGPGGMGKTRLAQQTAIEMVDQFENGVYFVSLGPIDSPDLIVQTISESIGFPLSTHEAPKQQLLRHLRNRHYMLVLDNFEHILSGAPLVSEILRTAGKVTILATSREKLNLHEETIVRIEGLTYPASVSAPNAILFDAVHFFLERTEKLGYQLREEHLPHLVHICQLVEGMPLGILLAAAWVDTLSLAEIASELSRTLDLLQTDWRDVPTRHRSVRAAFEPSWRRLSREQQQLFANLSIFKEGFTREAAEKVAGASILDLAGLVNKSLIRRDPENGRYSIHELLRQLAQERLERSPQHSDSIIMAHATYFAEFMQAQWFALSDTRQMTALAEIEADLENVRRAWRYWLDQRNGPQIKMFLDCFWRIYDIRGWYNSGEELFREAADAFRPSPGEPENPERMSALAHILAHQAYFLINLGYTKISAPLSKESVDILNHLNREDELTFPLVILQWNVSYEDDISKAMRIDLDTIKFIETPDALWKRAYVLCWQGRNNIWHEDYASAINKIEESFRIFKTLGDIYALIWPGLELGHFAILKGEFLQARKHYEYILRLATESNFDWAIIKAARYLGNLATEMGEFHKARKYLLQSLKLADDLGMIRDVVSGLYDMAKVEAEIGDPLLAAQWLALISHHPLSDQTRTFSRNLAEDEVVFRRLAENLLGELEQRVPAEEFNTAIQHGRSMDLDTAVFKLLKE